MRNPQRKIQGWTVETGSRASTASFAQYQLVDTPTTQFAVLGKSGVAPKRKRKGNRVVELSEKQQVAEGWAVLN
jgi:hypothetical protein